MVKASISWNTKQIAKMSEKGALTFDNALQRGFVWDNARMSLLVDSILRGYPIPPFYVIKAEGEEGNIYDCIDGKQRCTTVTRFRNNKFALGELDYLDLDSGEVMNISGMTYEDLPEELRDRFDSYMLTVHFFTDVEDHEIREMMNRLNNGKTLSNYEKARIKARDLDGVTNLAQHPLFLENLSEKAIGRYVHENLVVSSIMLLEEDEPCLESKKMRPFMEELKLTRQISDKLNAIYDRIKYIHDKLVAEGYCSVAKRVITRTHLVSIVSIIQQSIEDARDPDEMKEFIKHFFGGKPSINKEYNKNSTYGSAHTQSIKARLLALEEEYRKFFT